ncbi:hypothetical protein BGW39_002582 [Mortierella sp. 14UC]|nr:hypothetical protein BGW39_002582 [Mortierella sp. 14UC]
MSTPRPTKSKYSKSIYTNEHQRGRKRDFDPETQSLFSPLRHIPDPPNKSKYNKNNLPFLGLFFDIICNESGVTFRGWTEHYGGVICFKAIFNTQVVHIADPEAIQHVFYIHTYKYPKFERVVCVLSESMGIGLLLVEGDVHKQQRKIFTAAFSHKSVKELVPRMADPAEYLSKLWMKRIDESEDKSIEMNVMPDVASCALDILGLASFGYDFEALTVPRNAIIKGFDEYFSRKIPTLIKLLRHYVPVYREFDRICRQIINEKRAKAAATLAAGGQEDNDLLSLLLRTNEFPEDDGSKLSEDLVSQTFLAAGHDTSTVTVAWMLHTLATHLEVQIKLRQELLTRIELLHFIAPVPSTSRVASEDDTILGYDIPKGAQIYLAPTMLHKLNSVWGEGAEEFNPERWMDPSALTEEQRRTTKTVTPDMICIGSKLALIEVKVMLYYLLIDLEYLPVPGFEFRKSARITTRPTPGMNLILQRYKHGASPPAPAGVNALFESLATAL